MNDIENGANSQQGKHTSNSILQLQKVCKTFVSHDVEIHALQDIDLQINEGEYLTINGPSGCGKSTLLALMGLLDTPTQGRYLIKGVDTNSLDSDQQAELRNMHLGFVFQSFNLIDELSVFDNVALPLTYRETGLSRQEINHKVESALALVSMDHRKSHKPNQLSGGQQQRIAIARALAGDPSILLVDEPTGNLDSRNGDAVMEILSQLNSIGTTICMVTHDPRYASYAKRQVALLDGKIVNQKARFDTANDGTPVDSAPVNRAVAQ